MFCNPRNNQYTEIYESIVYFTMETLNTNEGLQPFVWEIIDKHFTENPQSLVRHHVESFNDFYKHSIFKIFKEKNPVVIVSKWDEELGEYRSKCNMYIGGKNGDLIHFAKPVIYDAHSHYMFPNEARLRNMTYAMTIHVDVELEYIDILEEGEMPHMNVEPDPNADPVHRPEKRGGFQKEEKMAEGGDVLDENEDVEAKLFEGANGLELYGGAGAKKAKNIRTLPRQLSPNEQAELRAQTEKSLSRRTQTRNSKIENIYFGKFPIMVQSDFCVLAGMPREMRFNMGECKNDIGGYFIIDGKEKTVIPQEKFGDNMLRVSKIDSDTTLFAAEIKSVSENTAKPVRTLRVELLKPGNRYSNMNIVVNIPNVRAPVPLFIVFRALGIVSDKEIIETCLLDLDKNESMMDLFIPSVHDAGPIMTQSAALHFIAHLTKTKTKANAMFILTDYFLPHIGETCYTEKAFFLGYMVKRLLTAYQGMEPPIDRDSFRYKRVELVGTLMYELFREYYKMQYKHISVEFEKRLYYNTELYENDLHGLVMTNYKEIFKARMVEDGFRKAFKGNWGATENTKRIGVVQDLNRLSFNAALSHLRKTNLSVEAGAKLVGPRVLNGSQWGLVDPIDTPDGGNIGLHKQLCIMTYVSRSVSREPMVKWLKEKCDMKDIQDFPPKELASLTKVIVNGYWAGVVSAPHEVVERFKIYRRNGLVPIFISICFENSTNTISVFTDGGRLCRPIFYYDNDLKRMSYEGYEANPARTWVEILSGYNKRKITEDMLNSTQFYELHELYDSIDSGESNPAKLKRFIDRKGIIDYIDPNEEETTLICLKIADYEKHKQLQAKRLKQMKDSNVELACLKEYTHCEIHESLIFGMMCNLVIYPHHNPATRNSFSTGQSKQAVSLYHTNFTMRMDKTAVVLNQGQKPLVKSRYYDYICHEENPYGENAIVALMCYTGYNVEDAVLINEGALQRGLFRTTYYTVYESHEERTTKGGVVISSKKFINIGTTPQNVRGMKPEYDYSKLDDYGLVKEGTEMNDRTIIIGCASGSPNDPDLHDASKTTKKGQLGIVDKTFITEGEEGTKIAKVRIREERIPAMGDKMASRSGQKGTIGQIIPERDMPFTKNGLKPDIIVNPHAMPTRMTVGQLVECLVGKTCLELGYHGDCTAFMSSDKQIGAFGEQLHHCGFHSSGNEMLYNGMTGEQLEAAVYIGPNYYMRLKHMVKDKVNYRAKGPRMMLTRQPVSGRANDGGLRIGEMERDVMIAHGATDFLRESMLDRGDNYYMAVCNKTGAIAIYNPEKNLFMSPMADGPLRYVESLDGKHLNVEQITKHGRSFSVVKVPYVFKLLMHELQTINVKMSIITEDNIDQFDSMNFSNNISLLTNGEFAEVKDVVKYTSTVLKKGEAAAKKDSYKDKELDMELEKEESTNKELTKELDLKPEPTQEVQHQQPDVFAEMWNMEQALPIQGGSYMDVGNNTAESMMDIGSHVIFGGDSLKPNRIWQITDMKGDFAVISTNDFSGGLQEPNNVVHKRDLKSVDRLIPIEGGTAFNQGIEGGQAPTSYVGQVDPIFGGLGQQHAVPTAPAVNVPITVVTGNHNDVKQEPQVQPQQQQQQQQPQTQVSFGGQASQVTTDFSKPMIKVTEGSSEMGEKVDTLGLGKGAFTVVKKE